MKWYSRLADVPGMTYKPLVPIDRASLWGARAAPDIRRFTVDGKTIESAMWPTPDGSSTSASPAHQHGFALPDTTPDEIILRMSEALELPGTARDYHFVLQGAYRNLWRHRKAAPALYDVIEQLCLLDIDLVERRSDQVFDDARFAVIAFGMLADMYKKEGRLRDALAVLVKGHALQQPTHEKELQQLRNLIEATA